MLPLLHADMKVYAIQQNAQLATKCLTLADVVALHHSIGVKDPAGGIAGMQRCIGEL